MEIVLLRNLSLLSFSAAVSIIFVCVCVFVLIKEGGWIIYVIIDCINMCMEHVSSR